MRGRETSNPNEQPRSYFHRSEREIVQDWETVKRKGLGGYIVRGVDSMATGSSFLAVISASVFHLLKQPFPDVIPAAAALFREDHFCIWCSLWSTYGPKGTERPANPLSTRSKFQQGPRIIVYGRVNQGIPQQLIAGLHYLGDRQPELHCKILHVQTFVTLRRRLEHLIHPPRFHA